MSESNNSSSSAAADSHHSFTTLGLGFTFAIALGFLVLLSTLLLASYICYRSCARSRPSNPGSPNAVALPRVIFVAEDDGDNDDVPAPGLDPAVISSYTKFPYSKAGNGDADTGCAICLCEYREGEMLRMMPDCRHRFHLLCVDAWLRLNPSCPVCRNSPMPTPLSTPLSELVPLSRFPADRRSR